VTFVAAYLVFVGAVTALMHLLFSANDREDS
jgi:hypothetical protein